MILGFLGGITLAVTVGLVMIPVTLGSLAFAEYLIDLYYDWKLR